MPDPWAIASAHEQQASPADRRRRGAWYTPRPLVEMLVALTLEDGLALEPGLFVVDPSCGGGGFVLGVLDHLVDHGVEPGEALRRVGGIDIDTGAVEAARSAMRSWCELHGLDAGRAETVRLAVGDSLDGLPLDWPKPQVVIGNPPFASPLRGGNLPGPAEDRRRARTHLLGPYADLAAVHLLAAVEFCAQGGRVCLVLPRSLLAGRDTMGLRAWLADAAPPRALWVSRDDHFAAAVKVWAPVLAVGGRPESVTLLGGTERSAAPPAPMAELVAEALGVPPVALGGRRRRSSEAGTLGDLATATAGFRDEYYGLAAACREATAPDDGAPRLVTSGTLDPLCCWWGRKPTTFAKRKWQRPVIDRSDLDDALGRWVDRQCRPKVVLPTQSRVFEPVIDTEGILVPVTPVIAVHCGPDSIGLVAAVLLAPPVVAWAHRRWFGTALSVDALKLAARNLGEIPLPGEGGLWQQAAAMAEGIDPFGSEPVGSSTTLIEIGSLMTRAYGSSREVLTWWLGRLPG